MIVRDAAAAADSESAYAAIRGDGASGERAFLGEFSELALEDFLCYLVDNFREILITELHHW